MGRQDAPRVDQAVDVVRRRLPADEDHVLSGAPALLREVGVEHDRARGGTRRGVEARRDDLDLGRRVDHRVEELVELRRVDPRHSLLPRDELLGIHLDGDPQGCLRGALAGARLEEEERPVLDGELDVLHLPVVLLEPLEGLDELVERRGEQLAHAREWLGGADPGHDVFSLGVDEKLPEERALTRRRVPREADARARGVARVPEHHLDDVHSGAEVVRDVVRAAVDLGARRLPRVEDGARGAAELLRGILGERLSHLALVDRLIGGDQLAEVVGGQVDVLAGAPPLLEGLELTLEQVPVDPVDDLAVHLDETPIRVVREAWVAGDGGEALDGDVVQAEVENRVHHPGHRHGGAGAHRDEERIGRVAEALAGSLLECSDVLVDLRPELDGHLSGRHRRPAGVGGDGEPSRDGDAERRHLREADPLPPEELATSRSLLVERIDQAHGADPMCRGQCGCREAGHDHFVGERQRKVNPRATARRAARHAVRRARRDPPTQAGWRELDGRAVPASRSSRSWPGTLGDRRRRIDGKLGHLTIDAADTSSGSTCRVASGCRGSSGGRSGALHSERSSGTATASPCATSSSAATSLDSLRAAQRPQAASTATRGARGLPRRAPSLAGRGRRVRPRSATRDRSSAIQASARSPSQIGVRTT